MPNPTSLQDDPIHDDSLPSLAATWVKEFRMPTDPPTRTTVYTSDVQRLAGVLGLPADMDPTKVVRAAADRIRSGQEADARVAVRDWLVKQQAAMMDERA